AHLAGAAALVAGATTTPRRFVLVDAGSNGPADVAQFHRPNHRPLSFPSLSRDLSPSGRSGHTRIACGETRRQTSGRLVRTPDPHAPAGARRPRLCLGF